MANKKVSEMTLATSVADGDYSEVIQGGDNLRVTFLTRFAYYWAKLSGAASKTTPVAADSLIMSDGEASGAAKLLGWDDLIAALAGEVGGASELSIPGTDLTAIGTTQEVTVGEAVAFGNTLYLKSDGKWWKADADAAATMPAMRMALATASADATCNTLVSGIARNDSFSLTVGATLYASDTAGGILDTPVTGTGDQVQKIGQAHSATVFEFKPSSTIVELV